MKTLLIFFACLILIVLAMSFLNTRSQIVNKTIDQKPTTVPIGKTEITGWIAAWDSAKASDALPPVMGKFTTFSPMLYRVMGDSSLGRHQISNRDEIISYARNENLPIAPVITDEGETERINGLLYDQKKQKTFIDSLVSEAATENFTGWSIDIEKLTSKDKNAFSNFVKNLSQELHKNNLKLYMIAYGKAADETYDPALAHDYKIFGQYADQVQLMIYYYNNEFTDPGGQTPLKWYKDVLQYAVDTIPREKILIGLSTYGNDWGGDEVEGLTYGEVQDRITSEDAKLSYNEKELSMVAKYEKDDKEHTLMYENAQTIMDKIELARNEFGINKFAFWQVSAEDPAVWNSL